MILIGKKRDGCDGNSCHLLSANVLTHLDGESNKGKGGGHRKRKEKWDTGWLELTDIDMYRM